MVNTGWGVAYRRVPVLPIVKTAQHLVCSVGTSM